MSNRPGWRPANTYVPEVTDLALLRADLTAYMTRPLLTDDTVTKYKACLKRFQTWCVDRGLPAFPTRPEVLGAWLAAALLGTARVDSPTAEDTARSRDAPEPLSMATVDQVWAAVAWKHGSLPDVSPTDDRWVQTVRRGLRRALAGHQVRKARPLMPEDMRALMSVTPTWTPVGTAVRGLLLAALDLPVRIAELAVLPPGALRLITAHRGELICPGRTFALECENGKHCCRVDCLLCALRACAELLPPDAPYLFGILPSQHGLPDDYGVRDAGDRKRQVEWACSAVWTRARNGPGCWPIEMRDGKMTVLDTVSTNPRLSAGLRHGLALSATEDGLRLLQQRAALLLAWHRGLRSDDVRRRSRQRLEPDELGYRLTIEFSKGDRQRRGVVLGVRPASDRQLDPVAALDDWLAVLDAAASGVVTSGELPLLVRCPRGANLTLQPVSYGWMRRHFADLQRRAGLSGFTPHSTRTGFAVTGADGDATSDQLRRVMRHKKVNAAVGYVMSRAARSRPAPLAMARAAAAA